MQDKALYESIFVRKSVRKYKAGPLPAPVLRDLEQRLGEIRPFAEAPVVVRLLEPDQIAGRFAVKAPHFLAAYAGGDVASLMAAGFALQQLELYLVSQGVGCCYSGMAKAGRALRAVDALECRMLLGFGPPDELARRGELSEFKRKPLDEICDSNPDLPRDLLEAVRLAPSGVNRQNWYFTGSEHEIQVCKNEKGGLVDLFAKNMGYIDIGIALCHLALAAGQRGLRCAFDLSPKPAAPPKGMLYACTARLEG